MNVLILTPDAVGSTLLQRLITIYMQLHEYDQPVINLHELTNGLAKYYSPEFNRELISKKNVTNWGYYQTLQQVVELLSSVDHYKTSRLAHYHIRQRGDSIKDQIPFYNYLNENFYIIACRRSNVFEHAVSMTLNKITKKLNVYDAYEKIDAFYEIYKSGVALDPTVFVNQLNAYKLYIDWSNQYFDVSSHFNYEQDIPRLEQYILDLPIFSNQSRLVSWQENFGISFNTWNQMHYIRSDVNSLLLNSNGNLQQLISNDIDLVKDYQQHAHQQWPAVFSTADIENLPSVIKQQWSQDIIRREGVIPALSQEKQQCLAQYKNGYDQAQKTINQMIQLGIIINGPPIKKQTLTEKRKIIKNFDHLVEIYNQWVSANADIALPMTDQTIEENIQTECQFWNSIINPSLAQSVLLPNQQ
jgi:hypothetical protein